MSTYRDHLVQHIRHPDLVSDSTLHVVGVVSNPERFQARYRHARRWIEQMESTPNVRAYVVETAFGDRHHEIIDREHERHLPLRTDSQCWIKESMINLGVRELLPRDWRYLAWVDMDITFRDPGWALEAMHQLQHFPLIQPWESAVDLGFRGRAQRMVNSFGYICQSKGHNRSTLRLDGPYGNGHTGYAWACTRKFYERVGGLVDFAILGAGDWHMAYAAIGEGGKSLNRSINGGYRRRIEEWQNRAIQLTHGEVGCSYGHIEHNFHGGRPNRKYESRWQALTRFGFDPDTDLIWDDAGLVRLRGNKPLLEIAIREYNRARMEDDLRDE
jgi:hypothetical protein